MSFFDTFKEYLKAEDAKSLEKHYVYKHSVIHFRCVAKPWNSIGKLIGYKMVDGNQFGLVIELEDGSSQWFFEEELSEIDEIIN